MTERDPQQPLWLAVRQGLLLIVGAIERTYGWQRRCPHCAKPRE